MKIPRAVLIVFLVAAPLSAQTSLSDQTAFDYQLRPVRPRSAEPPLSVRAFGLFTEQQFAAPTTFEAIFGSAIGPFFGGGAQVAFRNSLYVEFSASRFKKTGERAFRSSGQSFRLGIPLTATITPVEVSGGYRFRLRRFRNIVPFLGAGVGSYAYQETSESSDATENVDTRHAGFLAVGGVEFRAQRWMAVSVDAQYTHVPGILGKGGISQAANEKDLGGVAVRFKVIIGR